MFLLGKLSESDIIGMDAFYLHSVKPVPDHFACWALGNLAKEIKQNGIETQKEVALSPTEWVRLTRAAYRFHLLSELVDLDDWSKWNYREISTQALLDSVQPWEIEELYSFYVFAEGIYDEILNRIY